MHTQKLAWLPLSNYTLLAENSQLGCRTVSSLLSEQFADMNSLELAVALFRGLFQLPETIIAFSRDNCRSAFFNIFRLFRQQGAGCFRVIRREKAWSAAAAVGTLRRG